MELVHTTWWYSVVYLLQFKGDPWIVVTVYANFSIVVLSVVAVPMDTTLYELGHFLWWPFYTCRGFSLNLRSLRTSITACVCTPGLHRWIRQTVIILGACISGVIS